MKPGQMTPAHHTRASLAKLSAQFLRASAGKCHGLLNAEMRPLVH
jgi:folate-dependent tRNA-U54 methylase TrmFO/GidA